MFARNLKIKNKVMENNNDRDTGQNTQRITCTYRTGCYHAVRVIGSKIPILDPWIATQRTVGW